jgi:hypothetical protein
LENNDSEDNVVVLVVAHEESVLSWNSCYRVKKKVIDLTN